MASHEPLAIYRRPGKFIVKHFDEGTPGLWAMLGPCYAREKAQVLADALTLELKDARAWWREQK